MIKYRRLVGHDTKNIFLDGDIASTVLIVLSHWNRVTPICASKLSIIGSDNGLPPGRRQAIIWTKAGILLIRTLGTNFSEILSEILTFSFIKTHLKMSSAKQRPFCRGLNVLTDFDENVRVSWKLFKAWLFRDWGFCASPSGSKIYFHLFFFVGGCMSVSNIMVKRIIAISFNFQDMWEIIQNACLNLDAFVFVYTYQYEKTCHILLPSYFLSKLAIMLKILCLEIRLVHCAHYLPSHFFFQFRRLSFNQIENVIWIYLIPSFKFEGWTNNVYAWINSLIRNDMYFITINVRN